MVLHLPAFYSINGVQVFKNTLVTADHWGCIIFQNISELNKNIIETIYEEERYRGPGFVHLKQQNNRKVHMPLFFHDQRHYPKRETGEVTCSNAHYFSFG